MERRKLIKSEVASMFNTTVETLRHYEKKGLIHPEKRENGYRLYGFEDLQMLRQIFLFKEMELSLGEMNMLIDKHLNEAEYLDLLERHQAKLKSKIDRLTKIHADIAQLRDLLSKQSADLSFLLRDQGERYLYVLDPLESEVMDSPKSYYDKFESYIKKKAYSEKTLMILYPYDGLNKGTDIESRICIEVPEPDEGVEVLTEGLYLSIFYPFKHGNLFELPSLRKKIDAYLVSQNLKRVGDFVIELEHPELSLFLEEDRTVFELQIKVEKVA
ncbi:MerR family transcriptional regulator [Fusibacter sp. JL216-2]|uniref:MerR family transcriptional regulator n=1 Tax=Fusibacter sp. JL216-2 TaxID=3071453 RepID=UPI003D3388CE